MRNILILYVHTDEAHAAYAQAIYSLLDPAKFNVEICDEIGFNHFLRSAPKKYGTLLAHPLLRESAYSLSNISMVSSKIKHGIRQATRTHYSDFEKYIPDFILSVHPLTNMIASECGQQMHIQSGICIFPPFKVHQLWRSPVNHVIVPFQETADICKKMGLPATPLTYPVRKWLLSPDVHIADAFASLNLPQQYTVLLSVGGEKIAKKDIYSVMKKLERKANLLIFCGDFEDIKNELEKDQIITQNPHVRILGHTENIRDILLISNIHLMRSEANFFYETMATNTIPYFYTIARCQDKPIANLLMQKQLGEYGPIDQLLNKLILSEDQLALFRERIRKYLEEIHLYTEESLFNNFFSSIFPT